MKDRSADNIKHNNFQSIKYALIKLFGEGVVNIESMRSDASQHCTYNIKKG